MKEIINNYHIQLIETLNNNLENEIMNIYGIEYHKFLSQIMYPTKSIKRRKHYLVSIQLGDEHLPINLLSEKPSLQDSFELFFKYISIKHPTIQYSDSVEFNMIIYNNPSKINIKKYYMKDIINIKPQYVYFDWGSTLGAQGKSKHFFETHDKKYLNKGTLELLEHLYSKNVPMGIISNRTMGKPEFIKHLDDTDLLKYFDNILLSSEGYMKKPHSEMFIKGAEQVKVPPKYILYVGNNYIKDIVTATKNGYQTAYMINDNKGYEYDNISNYKIYNMNDISKIISF